MSRLLAEVIVFAVLALGGWAAWLTHDHNEIEKGVQRQVAAEKAAAAKQAKIDDAKLHAAEMSHEAELAALAAVPKPAVRVVCRREAPASGLPTPSVASNPDTAAPVLHDDPKLSTDIAGYLRLLASRADRLSADARQLDAAR